jgi:hypothetical protein
MASRDSFQGLVAGSGLEHLAFQLGHAQAGLEQAKAGYEEAVRRAQGDMDDPGLMAARNDVAAARAACDRLGRRYEAVVSDPMLMPAITGDADGFDLRPDPLSVRTSAELADSLRKYREWAGNPSLRKIAGRARPAIGVSTLCNLLRSDALPSLDAVIAIITGCGGSEEDRKGFATAWRRIVSSQVDRQSPVIAGQGLRMVHSAAEAS